jgi:hypothetical protein
LATTEPDDTFHDIQPGIEDNLTELEISDNGENGKDENAEEKVQCKPSEDNEPGWVIDRIS